MHLNLNDRDYEIRPKFNSSVNSQAFITRCLPNNKVQIFIGEFNSTDLYSEAFIIK